jgi:hypothetical protein
MDGDDYRNLPIVERTKLADWMCDVLGTVHWREDAIHEVTLGEGFIDIEQFAQNPPGHLVRDGDDWVMEHRRVPCRRPPPVWKPLR